MESYTNEIMHEIKENYIRVHINSIVECWWKNFWKDQLEIETILN